MRGYLAPPSHRWYCQYFNVLTPRQVMQDSRREGLLHGLGHACRDSAHGKSTLAMEHVSRQGPKLVTLGDDCSSV